MSEITLKDCIHGREPRLCWECHRREAIEDEKRKVIPRETLDEMTLRLQRRALKKAFFLCMWAMTWPDGKITVEEHHLRELREALGQLGTGYFEDTWTLSGS